MSRAIPALLTVAAIGVGCAQQPEQQVTFDNTERGDTNAWVVESLFDRQVEAGVVQHRSIYARHFLEGTATLNQRGARDVKILAKHFRTGGGTINVPRDGAGDELYEARVESVRLALRANGADPSRFTLADGFAPGDGSSSVKAAEAYNAPPEDFSDGGSSSSAGVSSNQ